MSKYLTAEQINNAVALCKDEPFSKVSVFAITEMLPSADVEPKWIPIKLGLPEDNIPVNITWINRDPAPYYADIKDKPFTATAVFYKNKWYWWSVDVEDMLAEYGKCDADYMASSIEVTAWMPLPKPYGEREETK